MPQMNEHVKGQPAGNYGPWTVPEDSYFMLGDNRAFSADSRVWNMPFVHRKAIVGKAGFRLFPNMGALE